MLHLNGREKEEQSDTVRYEAEGNSVVRGFSRDPRAYLTSQALTESF